MAHLHKQKALLLVSGFNNYCKNAVINRDIGLPAKQKRIASIYFQEIYGNVENKTCTLCESPVANERILYCSSAGCNLVVSAYLFQLSLMNFIT